MLLVLHYKAAAHSVKFSRIADALGANLGGRCLGWTPAAKPTWTAQLPPLCRHTPHRLALRATRALLNSCDASSTELTMVDGVGPDTVRATCFEWWNGYTTTPIQIRSEAHDSLQRP